MLLSITGRVPRSEGYWHNNVSVISEGYSKIEMNDDLLCVLTCGWLIRLPFIFHYGVSLFIPPHITQGSTAFRNTNAGPLVTGPIIVIKSRLMSLGNDRLNPSILPHASILDFGHAKAQRLDASAPWR